VSVPRHYSGACHCGAVRFEVESAAEEMTTCDCSLCVKKNALMIRVPANALRIVAGEEILSTYQWNTGRAKHHFCSRCGIYTFHRKRSDPESFGINIFCLEGFDSTELPVRATEGKGMSVVGEGDNAS
jgi:hypothetical protein